MKLWYLYILSLLASFFIFEGVAQNRCVTGEVLDGESGLPIADVQVFCSEKNIGAVTNSSGLFELCNITLGDIVEINHLSYYSQTIFISDTSQTAFTITLKIRDVLADEVVIHGSRSHLSKEILPGREKLSAVEIINTPAFLGQPDVIRTLQTMSGVQTVSEGVGDIFVRGGSPGHNLIFLDGMELMNPMHLFGIYSIFNPFTTQSVDLFKGHAPSSLGSRLSSVISVSSVEPTISPSEFSGSIGNVASSLGLTHKSSDGKWGLVMGVRRSLLELYEPVTSLFLEKEDDFFHNNSYYFYDFNGRLVFQPKATTSFSLNWYLGKDFFKMKSNETDYLTQTVFGNDALLLNWKQSISNNLKLAWNVGYTQAKAEFTGLVFDGSIRFNSGFKMLFSGIDLTGWSQQHSWAAGVKVSRYSTVPQDMNLVLNSDSSVYYNKFNNYQLEAYLEDSYKLRQNLTLYGGLRVHYYNTLGPYIFFADEASVHIKKGDSTAGDFYFSPSASLLWQLNGQEQFKWAWSRNVQMVHVASLSSMPLPNDIWMMATPNLNPQLGNQFSVGYYKQLSNYSFSSELFAKFLKNQSIFNVNTDGDGLNFEDHFFVGKGRAFGLELSAKKERGTVTGEVNYTLMRSERSFPDIYGGAWYPDKFDRTHDLSIGAQWKINNRWDLSAFFVYATGNSATLPSGRIWMMGTIMNDYTGYNNYRLPPYHRMDVSTNYRLFSRWFKESTLNFSIINIYNRANPYFIYFKIYQGDSRYDIDVSAAQVSLFPIMPSVSWRFII